MEGDTLGASLCLRQPVSRTRLSLSVFLNRRFFSIADLKVGKIAARGLFFSTAFLSILPTLCVRFFFSIRT